MSSAWERYLGLAAGLTDVTRKGAESVVKRLVSSGELASSKAEDYVDELLRASERNRRTFTALVRTETEKTVARLGLARRSELEQLRQRVARLEALSSRGGGVAARARGSAQRHGRRATTARRSAGAPRPEAAQAVRKSAGKTAGGSSR